MSKIHMLVLQKKSSIFSLSHLCFPVISCSLVITGSNRVLPANFESTEAQMGNFKFEPLVPFLEMFKISYLAKSVMRVKLLSFKPTQRVTSAGHEDCYFIFYSFSKFINDPKIKHKKSNYLFFEKKETNTWLKIPIYVPLWDIFKLKKNGNSFILENTAVLSFDQEKINCCGIWKWIKVLVSHFLKNVLWVFVSEQQ